MRVKFTEDWLLEHVLLINNRIVFKNLLHLLMIRLVCEHRKPLQLVHVLIAFKHVMRQDDIGINLLVKGANAFASASVT